LPGKAVNLGRGLQGALRAGLKGVHPGAEADEAADEVQRGRRVLLLGLDAKPLGTGEDRKPRVRRGEPRTWPGLGWPLPRDWRSFRIASVDVHDPVGWYAGVRQPQLLPLVEERRAAQHAEQHRGEPGAALAAARLGGVPGGDA